MSAVATTAGLLVREDGPAARITLNRPEKRNALGLELMLELLAALRRVSAADGVRAIVLDGQRPRVLGRPRPRRDGRARPGRSTSACSTSAASSWRRSTGSPSR